MEKQIHFTVKGQKLFGMLHIPTGKGPFPALSFFHGFTGQRIEPHRLFVKTARRLSSMGIVVLRFDFRGSGESEGDFKNMTLSSEITDAIKSLDFLSRQDQVNQNRLGVLGLSLGGFVASNVAARDSRVKALILWAAGAQASTMFPRYVHLKGSNRDNWIKAGEWDFGGNVLGSGFLKDLEKLTPHLKQLSRFPGQSLVIHGEFDSSVPVSEAEVYRQTLGNRVKIHFIKGADHTFNRKNWESEVIETTALWVKENL